MNRGKRLLHIHARVQRAIGRHEVLEEMTMIRGMHAMFYSSQADDLRAFSAINWVSVETTLAADG